MSAEFDNISFDMPKTQSNAIKVIGVGGGGSNAVNHMYSKQIHGVDFVICNTDAQALENSPIPNKVQLGAHLTSGLGAGANPEIGAQAAAESIQEIQQMLSTHTKMVFITAGMGGGTGTGAAPIIAKIAKDMDILTVGIVTMPFQFEGRMRSKQAQKGIDDLRDNVDSLIVINNNKLREVYGNLGFKAGFSKADEVLATAAKGIAEVITHHYKQNIDLHDAKTVLSNSGTAIMGSAKETGANRAKNAIVKALDSPLLNDNKITGAKNVLLLIVSGGNEVTLDEIGEINDYIQDEAGYDANIIMGIGEDESLEDGIAVTVVATGFAADQQGNITNTEVKKIVHTLEDEQKATYNFGDQQVQTSTPINEPIKNKPSNKVIHVLEEEKVEPRAEIIPTTQAIKNIDVTYDEIEIETVSEDDFIITNIAEPKVEEREVKEQSTQQDLLFDLPLNSYEEIKPASHLVETSNEIKNIEVEAEEVKYHKVEKRYVLDDFSAQPTIGKSSTPIIKDQVEEELQFEVKSQTQEKINNINTTSEEVSPLDLTISELQKRAKERREKMKGFNYKFNDQVSKNIDEIERQPAYKRLGVDIEAGSDISKSDTALNTDNNDLLRSNNSFLHDNVD
ncbi:MULTISPECIES: cell division protein FtsZ [Tenacibaculum]|uniref:Cell division protein FtsZ n=2 Tax=Tenacibaculum TaxID=104267 RepID=A0AAE9MPM0_9FLAO|nr:MULTISPECIES: cell division protein FtsZ [Tenacibaculum]GFD76260.1 cell division protein FtsZ [Tenacibaculum sp. KUL113]GFD82301.1 cell division protein FtsZ [Tenacibaculum sp. KUL118]GFD96530.1 cell division protein FtsZ [Alteromonas sp. KUL154]GFE03642.1 cell division protein FtsZ [Alteromonas sp. KUL156]AZJ32611.1 cell division protein FtsZ [Tenacibaculum mesophilum]|eukprot:TRINITY_DN508_c0_g7_i1.p1 TRINITY_DN508_c0_g7~~TRINITY_DN508_c0_g7_i1.p1  ORF type:complete len:621 (+),score=160.44 TRINITY_DN508_c0_g7_i1:6559-8421(+)